MFSNIRTIQVFSACASVRRASYSICDMQAHFFFLIFLIRKLQAFRYEKRTQDITSGFIQNGYIYDILGPFWDDRGRENKLWITEIYIVRAALNVNTESAMQRVRETLLNVNLTLKHQE